MTAIRLPADLGTLRIPTFTEFPTTAANGQLAVALDTSILYEFNGTTWVVVGGPGTVFSVSDTDSIDLTDLAGVIYGDLRLSANAASANNQLVSLTIEPSGSKGLRAQIPNASIRGVLSASAPVTYDSSTGIISMPQSAAGTDGYLSGTDWTTFNDKLSSSRQVNTTAPLAGGGALTADLTLSIPAANSTTDGYLTSSDWSMFDSKQEALSFSAPLSESLGVVSIPVATSLADGYLSSTDWGTFNAKVSATRAINTTSPLTGGGNLSADRTIAIPVATSLADGYLSSTDWSTFNSKVSATRAINTTSPLTGGGNLSADRTIAIPVATSIADGYLSSTDWSTFNSKVSATRSINTTAPLTGGGNLSADRTIAMPMSSAVADGYLSSSDWTSFNSKLSSSTTITATGPVFVSNGGDLGLGVDISMTKSDATTDGYLSQTDWNTFNGKQAAITVGSLGAGNANGLSLSAGSLVLHAATSTQPGAISTTTQTIPGAKTFAGDMKKSNNTTNTSYVGSVAPSSTGATATNLQSSTVTWGGTSGVLIEVALSTDESMLLHASYTSTAITAISDPSGIFLTSDAGTGIYVSKSAASATVSFKNRMGGSRGITVHLLNSVVSAVSGAWA